MVPSKLFFTPLPIIAGNVTVPSSAAVRNLTLSGFHRNAWLSIATCGTTYHGCREG